MVLICGSYSPPPLILYRIPVYDHSEIYFFHIPTVLDFRCVLFLALVNCITSNILPGRHENVHGNAHVFTREIAGSEVSASLNLVGKLLSKTSSEIKKRKKLNLDHFF